MVFRKLDSKKSVRIQEKKAARDNELSVKQPTDNIVNGITHIEKSQHDMQLLANIVSMSVDAISTGSLDGTFTSWNRAAEAIFGYTSEEIIGKDVRKLFIPPERMDEVSQLLRRNPSAVVRMRTERLHKSGRRIPVMMTAFPMMNERGEVYGRAAIHQDLTQIVGMETRLMEQSRMAAVGSMAASIAHEIRNPLFGISSVAQLLVREFVDKPELKELGTSMLSEIDRLNKMLRDLLLFSRPKKLQWSRIRPSELCLGALESLATLREEKKIRIVHRFEPKAAEITVDIDQIRQVILNLSLNALQATEPGQTVTLLSRVDPPSGWLFSIHNFGESISPDQMSRIFDPFYSTRMEGTGLGLSVCRKIVEDHGGTIDCNSSPTEGTQFVVRIPHKPSPS